MLSNKDTNNLRIGEEICLFKKEGVLPITCGILEYFDEKHDKICLNMDEGSVKLTKHLYDFLSASAVTELEPQGSLGRVRQRYLQFSRIM